MLGTETHPRDDITSKIPRLPDAAGTWSLRALNHSSSASRNENGDSLNMADLDSTFIPALHKPPALLPIAKHRESLLYAFETYPVTIVVGQTGSGKSTQIPRFLEQAGWCADGKLIAVTQVC